MSVRAADLPDEHYHNQERTYPWQNRSRRPSDPSIACVAGTGQSKMRPGFAPSFAGLSTAVVATECDGQPFITPLIFVYDEASHSVYFHTGRAGRIFANIGNNPRVCLNTSHMGRLMAPSKASGFDVEYESVTVFGRARVLEDKADTTHALRLLLDKYFPRLRYGEDYRSITPEELARVAVYRLEINSWSGKRNAPK